MIKKKYFRKNDKNQGQSFKKWENKNFLEFTLKDDEEEKGIITGTLIKHGVIDSYGDVFTKESLDLLSKEETRFLLHTHNWQNELGTMIVKQDKEGNLIFTGKLDLTLNEAGLPNNPEAHKIYSLMKQGASYKMSAGGNYIKAGFGDFETNAGTIRAYLIDEFSLSEGSSCIKGAVPGAGVEAVKMDNQENKIKKEGEENMAKKTEAGEPEVKEIPETTPEVTEEVKTPEQAPENTEDIEKKVNEMVEKRLGEEMAKINTDIRKGISTDMTKIQGEKDLNDYNKSFNTEFRKLDRSTAKILIPEPKSKEIIKDLKEVSSFFSDGDVITGQGETYKFPVRKDDRLNSVEQLGEKEGNTKEGELEYTFVEIGAGVLQNRFIVPDETLADISYDLMGEMDTATVEDFGEKIAELTVNGSLTSKNKIEGFLTSSNFRSELTATSGKVEQNDIIKLIRSPKIKSNYRKTGKLYVSPSLFTDMLMWVDKNGRPLLTATQTADGMFGYRILDYIVQEEHYLEEIAQGKYPAFFGNFKKFYAYYVRTNMFETEKDRDVNERLNYFYTRGRLGGKIVRPTAGVGLQVQ